MLNDIENAPTEFLVLLSQAEWADPDTLKFRDLLVKMSDEEFDALEADLERLHETGEKSRCIEWLEGYFQRDLELPRAA